MPLNKAIAFVLHIYNTYAEIVGKFIQTTWSGVAPYCYAWVK